MVQGCDSRCELHPEALSTEALHLIPHRRMGLPVVRLVPRRLRFRRLPITRPSTVLIVSGWDFWERRSDGHAPGKTRERRMRSRIA